MSELNTTRSLKNDWKAIIVILGARGHYSVPIIFAKNDRLENFYTDWYFYDYGILKKIRQILLNTQIQFLRRSAMRFDNRLPSNRVKSFPFLGILFTVALRLTRNHGKRKLLYSTMQKCFGHAVARNSFNNMLLIHKIYTESVDIS